MRSSWSRQPVIGKLAWLLLGVILVLVLLFQAAGKMGALAVALRLQSNDAALASELKQAIAAGRVPGAAGSGFGRPQEIELVDKIAELRDVDGSGKRLDSDRCLVKIATLAGIAADLVRDPGSATLTDRYRRLLTPAMLSLRARYLQAVLTKGREPTKISAIELARAAKGTFLWFIPQISGMNKMGSSTSILRGAGDSTPVTLRLSQLTGEILTEPVRGSANFSYKDQDAFVIDNPTGQEVMVLVSFGDELESFALPPRTHWRRGPLHENERRQEIQFTVLLWSEAEETRRVWSADPGGAVGDVHRVLNYQTVDPYSINLATEPALYCVGGQNVYSVQYFYYSSQ